MVEVRIVDVEVVRPMRLGVLRPDQTIGQMVWLHDDDPEARHFGAFQDDILGGIATIYPCALPERPELMGAWQLRGMATLPEVRGQGFGAKLVEQCAAHVRSQNGLLLWCNARCYALGFYEKLGFEVIGEEFEFPVTGPHMRMYRRL